MDEQRTHQDPSGRPPGPPVTGSGGGGPGFFDAVRGWGVSRSTQRWIGGVAAGLARRLGVDPALVRGLLAVSVFFAGIGLVLYGLAWAFLPEEDSGRVLAEDATRGRLDSGLVGAGVLMLIGLLSGTQISSPWWDVTWGAGGWLLFPVWLLALVLVVWGLFELPWQRLRGRDRSDRVGAGYEHATHVPPPSAVTRPMSRSTTSGPVTDTVPVGPVTVAPSSQTPPGQETGRRRRAQGPGVPTAAATAGLALIGVAGVLLARQQGLADLDDVAAAALVTAVATGVFGLGIVACGLRGRRSGVLGALAVWTVLIGSLFVARGEADVVLAGDRTWSPQTVAEASDGIVIGAGELTVDLSDLDLGPAARTGETVRVPVRMGAGTVRVVTGDVPTAVTGRVLVGRVGPESAEGGVLPRYRSAGERENAVSVSVDGLVGDVTFEAAS